MRRRGEGRTKAEEEIVETEEERKTKGGKEEGQDGGVQTER